MLSQLFLLLSLLSISCCHPFTATITAAPTYNFGDEVTCRLTITNSDDSTLYLLRRNTPLEAISSNNFFVTRNGEQVQYDGLFYQRSSPTSEEYLQVPAKTSVSSVVDLSHSYPLASEGRYTVKLDSTITYYKSDISNSSLQKISSNLVSFEMNGEPTDYSLTEAGKLRNKSHMIKTFTLPSVGKTNAYRGFAIAGTPTSRDITSISSVYPASYNILSPSADAVNRQTNLYNAWFGIRYQGYLDLVRGAYLNIKTAMEQYKFTIYFDGPQCQKIANVIAYTYKASTTIYVCALYRSEPDIKGVNTKLGTIVHEFTHAVAYTDDITYGQQQCRSLAYSKPEDAIRNADNYHYFTEPLAQKYL